MVTIWDMYDSYEAVAKLEAIGLYLLVSHLSMLTFRDWSGDISLNHIVMYCQVQFCYCFVKSKIGKFLYSAVSNDCSKHFTLYFPDRPVHSVTISASLGNNQPYVIINAQRLLIHMSTTVYSQVRIHTAE